MKPIITLFFNEPNKQWHFEQLRGTSGLSRAQTNAWLQKLLQQKIIQRIKPKHKMPYYLADLESSHYYFTKRIFSLQELYASGLLSYLYSLDRAQCIILFGSFSRGDWHTESDIDLFIYGDIDRLQLGPYLSTLGREIEIFSGKNEKDLQRMGSLFLTQIINGICLKGEIPEEVIQHAAIPR